MSGADELRKIEEMRQSGALSEEEYARAKAAILSGSQGPGTTEPRAAPVRAAPSQRQVRRWAMLLHFSQLAWLIVYPLAGVISHIVPQVAEWEAIGGPCS